MNPLADKVRQILADIEAKINELQSKINSALSKVPGFLQWAVDQVIDAWNKLMGKLAEFWDWFTDKLAYVGSPSALHALRDSWHNELGVPTDQRAGEVDSDDLMVDENWTGTAADAYKSKIGEQKEALEGVGSGSATTVGSALNGVASGIDSFWTGVIAGLAILVPSIVVALVATGTIIGIPVAVLAVITAVVGFFGPAYAGLSSLQNACSDAAASLQTAQRYADEWPSFAVS